MKVVFPWMKFVLFHQQLPWPNSSSVEYGLVERKERSSIPSDQLQAFLAGKRLSFCPQAKYASI